MKVHLIRSEGFKMEDYNHVFNILNQYSGGITFVPSEPIVLPDTDLKLLMKMKILTEGKPISGKRKLFLKTFISSYRKVIYWEELFTFVIYTGRIIIFSDETGFIIDREKK